MEILVFCLSFILSLILSDFFVKNMQHFTFYKTFSRTPLDTLDKKEEVLKVGGIILFASVVLAFFFSCLIKNNIQYDPIMIKKIIGFTAGSIIILFLGLYDDAKKIGYKGKMLWEMAAITPLILAHFKIEHISLAGRTFNLSWAGYAVLIMWILLVTNAINLIDGLDGLASGVAIITFSALAIISHNLNKFITVLSIASIGSLIGFLRYNFHPAKLYLGDNGSLLIGFMLAVFSIEINVKMNTLTALSLPILILMLPMGSAIYSFSRRVKNGKNPFVADRLHLHYLLLNSGIPYLIVVFLFWLSSLLLTTLGVVSYFTHRRFEFIILAFGILILIAGYSASLFVIKNNHVNNKGFEDGR